MDTASWEAIQEPNTKVILLLRNFHDLAARSVYPLILRTYANIAPEKLKDIHPAVNMERALDETLSLEDRFGTFAFDPKVYGNLIQLHEELSTKTQCGIIYYEDLVKNYSLLYKVADFLGIEYQREKVELDQLKERIKDLYVKGDHFPSPPEGLQTDLKLLWATLPLSIQQSMVDYLSPDIYNKYLSRYTIAMEEE
jgi:hypothetical protein